MSQSMVREESYDALGFMPQVCSLSQHAETHMSGSVRVLESCDLFWALMPSVSSMAGWYYGFVPVMLLLKLYIVKYLHSLFPCEATLTVILFIRTYIVSAGSQV